MSASLNCQTGQLSLKLRDVCHSSPCSEGILSASNPVAHGELTLAAWMCRWRQEAIGRLHFPWVWTRVKRWPLPLTSMQRPWLQRQQAGRVSLCCGLVISRCLYMLQLSSP